VPPGLQNERKTPGEPQRNALGFHKKRRAKLVCWMLGAEDCVAPTRKGGSCARERAEAQQVAAWCAHQSNDALSGRGPTEHQETR
jgi:hypothetical protein